MVENVDVEKVKKVSKTSEVPTKVPNKTSEVDAEVTTEVPKQMSEQENKEQNEEQIEQNFAKIPTNKTSEVPNEQKPFVCEKCGKGFDTKKALTGHMSSHSREKKKKKETKDEKKPLVPYADEGGPENFLRRFLEVYEFKDKFIDILCRRVVLRSELPHPNSLADDILSMEGSGVSNARNANAIAEDYSCALKKYLGERGKQNRQHTMGYDMRPSESYSQQGGIPMHEDYERPQGRGIPVGAPQRDRGEEERRYDKEDMDRPLTMKDLRMWQLREENRRLKEGNGRRNPDTEQSWMRERLIKMEDDLRQRDADRMQRLEEELKEARNTPPPQIQVPNGPSREEIMQMVERSIDAQTKKLTPDDVERIVQRAMGDSRPLTKSDLKYFESRDKLRLEEKKLDESGKTRDEIAGAIRGGFSHAGKIIGRMMTEEGATSGTQVKGYTDQMGNMMQVACPKCNAVITAPVGSSRVVCPGCHSQWEVERPGYEQIPAKTEEKKTPADEFTPEQKKVIEKSLKDAKEGRIEPLETSESTTEASGVTSEPTTDATGVEKIAENIAIGEAATKLEEEVKKELPVEKKPWPKIDSNFCPICKQKCKNRRGVASHIVQKHPDYKK